MNICGKQSNGSQFSVWSHVSVLLRTDTCDHTENLETKRNRQIIMLTMFSGELSSKGRVWNRKSITTRYNIRNRHITSSIRN